MAQDMPTRRFLSAFFVLSVRLSFVSAARGVVGRAQTRDLLLVSNGLRLRFDQSWRKLDEECARNVTFTPFGRDQPRHTFTVWHGNTLHLGITCFDKSCLQQMKVLNLIVLTTLFWAEITTNISQRKIVPTNLD